jgi:hypothetical protein
VTGLELRLLGYGLAALALFGGWQYVEYLQRRSARVDALVQEVADLRVNAATRDKQDEQIAKDQAATVAAAVASGLGAVRLCKPASAGPAAPAAVSGGPGAGPGAGALPAGTEADRDIGPDLEQLGDEADALIVTARACQQYVRDLPEACRLPE